MSANGVNGYSGWFGLYSLSVAEETPRPLLSPTACGTIATPEAAGRKRKLDCRHYDKCLTIAVDEKWESFTCRQCRAYDPKTRMEMIRESSALCAILDRTPGK